MDQICTASLVSQFLSNTGMRSGKPLNIRRRFLAARQLVQANAHGAVVPTRLLGHAPAQVDGLKAQPLGKTVPLQLGEDLALENIPLGLHIREGRTDKEPDGAGRGGQIAGPVRIMPWIC